MRSLTDKNIQVINFDLQKVLVTPKLFVSDAYYSRKLATYNFTTYDLSSRNVDCYVWDESQAKRGSCEIATCLLMHNRSAGEKDEVAQDKREISSFVLCVCTLSQIYLSKPLHTITLKEVTPKWRGILFTQQLKMLQNVWKFTVQKIGFLGLKTQNKILPSTM